jgi:hypothetical protein
MTEKTYREEKQQDKAKIHAHRKDPYSTTRQPTKKTVNRRRKTIGKA